MSSPDKNLPYEILRLSHFGFKYCSAYLEYIFFYWNNNLLFSAIGLPPSMILPCRPNVCSLCNFSKTPFPEWQPILLPNWLISIQLTWGITISKGSLRRVSEKQFMVSYYLHRYIFFTNVVKDFTKDSPSCFDIYFDCSWVTCSNFCGLFLYKPQLLWKNSTYYNLKLYVAGKS